MLLHPPPLSRRARSSHAPSRSPRVHRGRPDLPGRGLSDAAAGDEVDALAETLDALGLDRFVLHGGELADALARQWPERVLSLVPDEIEYGTPPAFVPRWDGTHLLEAWCWHRDRHLFSPGDRREAAARVPLPLPDARSLHAGTLDLLAGPPAGDHEPAYAETPFGQLLVQARRASVARARSSCCTSSPR